MASLRPLRPRSASSRVQKRSASWEPSRGTRGSISTSVSEPGISMYVEATSRPHPPGLSLSGFHSGWGTVQRHRPPPRSCTSMRRVYPARPMEAARRLAGPMALAALAALYLYTLGRPSLWFDEAWEANYYAGFSQAPWYNRPILYMSAEKALVHALGPHELVLRLLPCLAGLAAIGVTFVLVRQEAGRLAAWTTAVLLAVAPSFLFHAHELKNYTLDALFAALLVLLWTRWRASRTPARLLAFAGAAALSFGLSFTGVFVIAVCAAGEAWAERKTPRRLLPFGATVAGLAVLFSVVYLVFHASAVATGGLQDQFPGAFPPASVKG